MAVEDRPDIYRCDNCGHEETAPVAPGWFEVGRIGPLVVFDDWWQETRHFCSTACLRSRLRGGAGADQ